MKQRLFAKTALSATIVAVLSGCATTAEKASSAWDADSISSISMGC